MPSNNAIDIPKMSIGYLIRRITLPRNVATDLDKRSFAYMHYIAECNTKLDSDNPFSEPVK